jgi:hypothetical protein
VKKEKHLNQNLKANPFSPPKRQVRQERQNNLGFTDLNPIFYTWKITLKPKP